MLKAVYDLIQEDLDKVEDKLHSISEVSFRYLSELLGHSLEGGGKRIRPALVLLSGKFYNYDLDPLLLMATTVEVMHTATLVHDDAIDKSLVRRGRPTINKIWGEDMAMLLGDYLFAKAGELASDTKNIQVVKLVAQTLMTISSGEINQNFDTFNLKQTFENYLQRISSKTASLFVLSTESGAILSGASDKSITVLRDYGYNLGITFQIVDDVLDFVGTEEELGKPVGSDLSQGTLTLPSMLALERYPEDNPIERLFQGGDRRENIKRAIELVRNSSIVEDCYKIASDYCARGCSNLHLLPDSPIRQALIDLAAFMTSRNK